ncbi:MAG: phosphoribosylglycinamide formyltransferase [Planctomycetota bacterium]
MSHSPLPIAVFISGGGRSLANLIRHRDERALPIEIRLVLSSSSKVRGVEIARDAGIQTQVVWKSKFPDAIDYSNAMFEPCRQAGVELVVMAGYLKHVQIPDDFSGKVINIHPSLLPQFGGEGMYGDRVHRAVLSEGASESGCTVHYVDNQYDNGPILLQQSCSVQANDTASSLAARVFELECEVLPEAIRQIASKRSDGI